MGAPGPVVEVGGTVVVVGGRPIVVVVTKAVVTLVEVVVGWSGTVVAEVAVVVESVAANGLAVQAATANRTTARKDLLKLSHGIPGLIKPAALRRKGRQSGDTR
jgi:hypothetical protein